MTSSSSPGAPATEPAPHVIVVTLDCDGSNHTDEPHDTDCYERTVECPGVTARCEQWTPCEKTPECSDRSWPEDDDYATFHGVEHQFLRHDGGWWGVPDGLCFYQASDHTCDAIADMELAAPGRYPVDVEVDDECPRFHLMDGAAR